MAVYLGTNQVDPRMGTFIPLPLDFNIVPYSNDPWVTPTDIDIETMQNTTGKVIGTKFHMTDEDVYNFIDPYFDVETDPTPGVEKLNYLFDRNTNPHLDTSTRWVPKTVDPNTLILEDKCVNIIDLNNVSSDIRITIPLEPPVGVTGLCEFALVLISSKTRRRLYIDNLSSWYGSQLSNLDTGKNSYYITFQQINLPTANALTSNWIITATQLTAITQ